jgi:hypothetical protein
MITEDQLEQLAIQWFQDTGWNHVHGAVIAPECVAAGREALRTLTPALCLRPSPLRSGSHGEKEEDGRLAEVRRRVAVPGQVSHVFTRPEHQMGRPFRAWKPVVDGTQGAALGCRMMPRWGVGKERGKPLNKERRYPIALTMRGPWGSGLPQFMGFPWTSADGLPWGHPECASRDLPSLQMQASGFRRFLVGMRRYGEKRRLNP